MKHKCILFVILSLLEITNLFAQQPHNLTLSEAVSAALSNGDRAKLSDAKVNTAKHKLETTKNNQYPDFKISGQYQYLTNAKVDMQIATGNNNDPNAAPSEAPNVNRLLLGQVNLSVPLFSGFKLKNAIKASENSYEAATYMAKDEKEQIVLQTIKAYINLYKVEKTVNLISENLKSASQRVQDFTNMEVNGLLAINDLLKAQLQESTINVSLEEAKKNERILKYQLITHLKLPANTNLQINDNSFNKVFQLSDSTNVVRNDLKALQYQEAASKNNIKVAKSHYYPSLAIVGGYTNLDLHNAITVTNAMNIGLGISYNLADIFKAKSDVKLAQSQAEEVKYNVGLISDQIKVEVKNANLEYELALKKVAVYEKSQEQAIENYRIVKDKYDNGLSDTNDLLEADVAQLQAKINLATAHADITQKYYELKLAQGGLVNEFFQQ